MTFLSATGNYFPHAFAIVTGIIDATAILSPLLWAMIILLLLCAVGIAADRDQHRQPQRRDGTLVPLAIVHRERVVITQQWDRAA